MARAFLLANLVVVYCPIFLFLFIVSVIIFYVVRVCVWVGVTANNGQQFEANKKISPIFTDCWTFIYNN